MAGVSSTDVSNLDLFGDSLANQGAHYPMVVLTMKKLLQEESQFQDFTIQVGADKVYAHTAVLAVRCQDIVPMPNEGDKKKKQKKPKEYKVKGITDSKIMRRVLEFLYTGMVEFPKLATLDILSLNAAARHFRLNRLGYLCERWLREHLCMDNVFHLLKGAVDQHEMTVKAFCLQYALDNYTQFIANKDGIHILGIDLFQEVVKAFTDRPPPPEEVSPDQAPPDTLIEDFKKMYDLMPYADVIFNVGGMQIKCHKAVLAAHSPDFVPLVSNAPPTGVDFNSLSPEAFKNMLKFLYYGDDNIEPHPATELVGFSKQFKLHSLLRICEDKCRTSVSVDTVLDILQTTYIPEMEEKKDLVRELHKKTFPFILANLTDIDLTPIRKMTPNIAIDILMEIQKSWGEDLPPIPADEPAAPSNAVSPRGGGGFLGSQRGGDRPAPPPPARGGGDDNDMPPPPPPRGDSSAKVPAPPRTLPPPTVPSRGGDQETPPPPPPRDGGAKPPPSIGGGGPTPPPRIGDPPPPIVGRSESSDDTGDTTPKKKKGDDKKKGDAKKPSREESKKLKDEKKRIEKEKKQREKLEKKKGGKKT